MLRRIARGKSHWIAAALLLAGSGCSTAPAKLDSVATEATGQARRQQLEAIARKYQSNGREAEAEKIQKYIAANFPNGIEAPAVGENSAELMRRMGVNSGAKKGASPESGMSLAEVQRRNQEIEKQLQDEVRDIPVRNLAGGDLQQRNSPEDKQREITPVSVAAQRPNAGLTHADLQSKQDAPAWANSAESVANATGVANAVAPPSASRQKLVPLCETLPADLQRMVTLLESPHSSRRVQGLLQLCEQGSRARGAGVAVHVLLEDSDPIVTVYAAGTLHRLTGDSWDSVRILADRLEHRDDRVARLASYLLGEMGPTAMAAVPQLEQLRDSDRGLTSLHAAEALTRIAPADPQSIRALVTALSSDNHEERWFAAVSLGSVDQGGSAEAARSLLGALKDKDESIRRAACLSLGGLGPSGRIAAADLKQLAETDTPEVRAAARTALECLR